MPRAGSQWWWGMVGHGRSSVCVRSSVGMMNANFLFDPELLHFAQVRNKLCTALRMRNLIATNNQLASYGTFPLPSTTANANSRNILVKMHT